MRGNALEMEAILQRSIKYSLDVTNKSLAAHTRGPPRRKKERIKRVTCLRFRTVLCTLYNSFPAGIISTRIITLLGNILVIDAISRIHINTIFSPFVSDAIVFSEKH